MPKKRTIVPFYGKREQHMEAFGREAMRNGNHEQAAEFMKAAKTGANVKMMRHARAIARRPIGRFLKVPQRVLSFMRSYGRGR